MLDHPLRGGLTVLVISTRSQTADPMFFELFGTDIAKARTVIVKSRGHFRAGRKLAIALWHYLEQGLVPQGATLTR